VLLTGDIEKEAEQELITSKVKLKSNILKVPHHGSITSSLLPFLKKVRPEAGIISLRGSYFPDADVINRYSNLGVKIFRTDKLGMIRVIINGKTYKINGYLKN
jgi:competence protein ComEC